MKAMKLVRENINFEKGQDPKKTMKTGLLGDIQRMGVAIPNFKNDHPNWNQEDVDRSTKNFNEDLPKFHYIISKLIECGVDPKVIRIADGTTIAIDCFEVMSGNHVILHTLTEEDAKTLIKICDSVDANQHYENRWNIGRTSLSHYIYVHGDNKWLDNLIETRKKLKNIL